MFDFKTLPIPCKYIYLIIFRFFSVVALYIIGGVIFMKYRNSASGIEMIPNIEIWKALPSNIKVNYFNCLINQIFI